MRTIRSATYDSYANLAQTQSIGLKGVSLHLFCSKGVLLVGLAAANPPYLPLHWLAERFSESECGLPGHKIDAHQTSC